MSKVPNPGPIETLGNDSVSVEGSDIKVGPEKRSSSRYIGRWILCQSKVTECLSVEFEMSRF